MVDIVVRGQTEDALLARLIEHPSKFSDCDLDQSYFARQSARETFAAMGRLYSNGNEWDVLILYHEMGGKHASYVSGLADIIGEGGVSRDVKDYVTVLKSYRAQQLIDEVSRDVDSSDPIAFARELEARASKLSSNAEVHHVSNIAKEVFDGIEKAASNPEHLQGVTSGLKAIDNYTWGFQPATLYIIAARPSMGKSAMAANIAYNAAESGHSVYVQSLEESEESIVCRILSRITRISNENLQRGKVAGNDWDAISDNVGRLSALPLWINEKAGLTSGEIMQRIRRHHALNPIELVVIDHLQKIREKEEKRDIELATAASNFKTMAKELRIPVIVLCQLNREVEKRGNKEPMLSDLRESGAIEAEADVVFGLFRPAYYDKELPDNELKVGVLKNRNGRIGTIELGWDAHIMTVRNSIL